MLATLKLLNAYFWKTIYGPILAFVFPVILLGILGSVLRLEYVYPGLIALSMMFLGVIALPLAIMELKSSSLFKYIGSSPVSPIKFTLVVIGFYVFIALITGVIIFLFTMALFSQKVFVGFVRANGASVTAGTPTAQGFRSGVLGGIFTTWRGALSFYLGSAIHLVFVVITGIVIATFSRTPQQALTVGIIIILPSMFLSGMVVSVDILAQSPVMNWISRFIPYRYSTGNLVVAATPLNQLNSAITTWLNSPFFESKPGDLSTYNPTLDPGSTELRPYRITDMINGAPNNMFDQIIWPFRDPNGGFTYPDNKPILQRGYMGWVQSGQTTNSLTLKAGFDPTLYNLLVPNWRAMELASANNIFNWLENWGVRKVPDVDSLVSFVTGYFRGVDKDGNYLPPNVNFDGLLDRVRIIAQNIRNGDFRWLEIFTNQSNILYYQADKVLNVLLPLGIVGTGSFYVYKNFTWVAH